MTTPTQEELAAKLGLSLAELEAAQKRFASSVFRADSARFAAVGRTAGYVGCLHQSRDGWFERKVQE